MFSEKDKAQFKEKGIEISDIEKQLRFFSKGFPFLHLYKPATLKEGIVKINKEEIDERQTSEISTMPSLANILTVDEVRDLIAYLVTLQEAPRNGR